MDINEKKAIIKRVMANSYMELEVDLDNPSVMSYVTRKHGDMMNDEAGAVDIAEARIRRKEVSAEIPGIDSDIDLVDEWTYLTFKLD